MSGSEYLELAVTAGHIPSPDVACCIDPLTDPRWSEFLQKHPRASLFHSPPWLHALSKTYGYIPIVYTTSSAGEPLRNGIVFCQVESWLTGRRLVSLPFSDHCEPLVDTERDLDRIHTALEQEFRSGEWRYIELRPLLPRAPICGLHHAPLTYSFHQLDLTPYIGTIFRGFHKNSTQRKIRRAEREGLTYVVGSTKELVDDFYKLFTLTRRRHQLPPQPRAWFHNLIESFGDALKLRVAFKGTRAVAAILTIRYKETMVYKYGCCDSRFNNLGGMHLLLWRSIQEAKAAGLRLFDFGRSNAEQQGLITFKNRWGAVQSVLTYSRYGLQDLKAPFYDLSSTNWTNKTAKYLFAHMSTVVLPTVGEVLYRHAG